jgi:hypothetical protein
MRKNTRANQVTLHVQGIEQSAHHHLRIQKTVALEQTGEDHLLTQHHHDHLHTQKSKSPQ